MGLLLLHLVVNAWFITQDERLDWFDERPHFARVQYGRAVLAHLGPVGLLRWTFERTGTASAQWPLAFYVPAALVGPAFERGMVGPRLCSTLYFGLMLLAVYALGRRFHGPFAGLFAAALCAFCPALFGASRHITPDMAGAAALCGCLYLMLRTRGFSVLGPSLLTGAVLGLSTAMRPHVLVFIGPPMALYGLLSVLLPGPCSRWRRLAHLAGMGLIAALGSVSFWWNNLPRYFEIARRHQEEIPFPYLEGRESSLDFYLRGLPYGGSPALFWIAVACVALLLLPRAHGAASPVRRRFPELLLLGVAMVSGAAAFSMQTHHYLRYLIPVYPLLMLLAAVALFAALPPWPRSFILAPFLGIALATWGLCTFTQTRPLVGTRVWLHCDPCWTRRQPEISETAGPPKRDEGARQILKMVSILGARHPEGRGVLLRLYPTVRDDYGVFLDVLPYLHELPYLRVEDPLMENPWLPERPFFIYNHFPDDFRYFYTLDMTEPGVAPPLPPFGLPLMPGVLVHESRPPHGRGRFFRLIAHPDLRWTGWGTRYGSDP